MKNSIQLTEIIAKECTVVYRYEIGGDDAFRNYFLMDVPYQIEYNTSIEHVPPSLLAVPFVGNMLGFALIFDAEILVPELDADFYRGIPDIVVGFAKMYAGKPLGGSVQASAIVQNASPRGTAGGSLLFYGGGVDSAYSLIQHHQAENVTLFHIWGADTPLDNAIAWENAYAITRRICEQFEIFNHTARANLHLFFKEGLVDGYALPIYRDNYWHGFQHSVGMLTIAAPLVWLFGYNQCLFASTYSAKDKPGEYICASDPAIDNFVRFSGCQVRHDGYDQTRQDKIHQICLYAKEHGSIPLRVCFSSRDGKNCNACEKCTRTAFAFFAEGMDCNRFGMNYDIESLTAKFHSAAAEYLSELQVSHYRYMQQAFQRNFKRENVPKGLLGFYDLPYEEYTAILSGSIHIKRRYNELKDWTNQLQDGKNWLEHHASDQEVYIQELEQRLRDSEKIIEKLENEAKHKRGLRKDTLIGLIRRIRPKHD